MSPLHRKQAVNLSTLFGCLMGKRRYAGWRCRTPAGPISVCVMAYDDTMIATPGGADQ
jgi:hypothetical protein